MKKIEIVIEAEEYANNAEEVTKDAVAALDALLGYMFHNVIIFSKITDK